MDIQKTRQDFPLLNPKTGKKAYIYFDSACQSLRPQAVIDTISQYYLREPACAGRSMHQLAAEVSKEVDLARGEAARFFNAAKKEEIVFTRNATEAINLVAGSLRWQPGDGILISDKEHNSNLIPWQRLTRSHGVQLHILPSCPDHTFDLPAFEHFLAVTPRVKLVAVGHTSNLDGVTVPAADIIRLAHRHGALVLLDAAQSAPHRKINVRELDVDFLAVSAHKMLGPSGMGMLYGKLRLLEQMEPFLVGGDTVSQSTYTTCQFLPPPEKFEAGLQDYAGIMGTGAALRYLQSVGFDAIQRQEALLNQHITQGIRSIPGLKILGPADPHLRGGIVTFTVDGIDSHRIALMLDQMANIQVRSGQHCVHSWFHAHQVPGSVRASLYFYNTLEEAQIFVTSLNKIRKVL